MLKKNVFNNRKGKEIVKAKIILKDKERIISKNKEIRTNVHSTKIISIKNNHKFYKPCK